MKEKKTAAAYIRVSTDDQLEYSPESQKKNIIDFAKKNNMILPEEFIFQDDGISGRSAAKRPAFQELISAAKVKPRQFDVVLVWKFSRFARNQEESIFYKSMLMKNNGIEVMSVSEQLPDSEFGSLIERIIEWFDEYYSIRLSGEVKRGQKERLKSGKAVSAPPYGYRFIERELTVDSEEAVVVKKIFSDFLSGVGIIKIAKNFNDLGWRTRKGNLWEKRTIRYILNNPVYCGKLRWNPDGTRPYTASHNEYESGIISDGIHESIISEDVFDAAQKKLERYYHCYTNSLDGKAQRLGNFMLQGMVKCSDCGATLSRYMKIQLRCNSYIHGKCKTPQTITMELLERLVLEAMEHQFRTLDFKFASSIPSPMITGQQELLVNKITVEQTALRRCKEAYAAGIDTIDEYKENKQAIQSRINILEKQLEKLSAPTEEPDKAEFAKRHTETLSFLRDPNITGEEKNEAIRTFVDHITFNKSTMAVDILFRA